MSPNRPTSHTINVIRKHVSWREPPPAQESTDSGSKTLCPHLLPPLQNPVSCDLNSVPAWCCLTIIPMTQEVEVRSREGWQKFKVSLSNIASSRPNWGETMSQNNKNNTTQSNSASHQKPWAEVREVHRGHLRSVPSSNTADLPCACKF